MMDFENEGSFNDVKPDDDVEVVAAVEPDSPKEPQAVA